MSELPTGTLTFLLTDIEGSTRLWEEHPGATRAALVRHDKLIEQLVARHHGRMVRPRGEGDSRFAVFAEAAHAVSAACAIQRAFVAEVWATPRPLRVRMALHTGTAELREKDYYGSDVNRCARLRAVAHGGQTLLSARTAEQATATLPNGVMLRGLGRYRLKDLGKPERIYQLLHPDLPAEFPPLKSLSTLLNNLPQQTTSFVGRQPELAQVSDLMHTSRLLTLTGAGGAGKTRLGLEVAADALDHFDDGVWFVDVAPLADGALVVQAFALATAAEPLFSESLALARSLGYTHGVADNLSDLGLIALFQGDHARARDLLEESLHMYVDLGFLRGVAASLECLAGVSGVEGHPAEAARLFGHAAALRTTAGAPLLAADRSRYEPMLTAARDQLDADSWEKEWAAGKATPTEELLVQIE
jgi:class 3 adenylate cyclase